VYASTGRTDVAKSPGLGLTDGDVGPLRGGGEL
jgi:hypothetical protein